MIEVFVKTEDDNGPNLFSDEINKLIICDMYVIAHIPEGRVLLPYHRISDIWWNQSDTVTFG